MASSCWESASFARGREFEPGWRHKKRPHTEASSMLDKSFCAKPDKWLWPTTVAGIYGGSDEARTRYLIVANDALSQVSYRPKRYISYINLSSYFNDKKQKSHQINGGNFVFLFKLFGFDEFLVCNSGDK